MSETPKCTCPVNTPELYYHIPKCPYKDYMNALKKEANKEVKAEDEH